MHGNIRDSIQSSEFSIAINPDDAEAILNKANGLFSLGNYHDAREFYRRYAQLYPGEETGELYQGICCMNENLIDEGIDPEDLIYYGLEYKFVTQHVIGQLTEEEMFRQLEIAIHQFAKRQMTWFRGMEKRGTPIHWLSSTLPPDDFTTQVLHLAETLPNSKNGS
jgi:tetratricopeptide (TPR) repeat protein